jgi:hypothetical protein
MTRQSEPAALVGPFSVCPELPTPGAASPQLGTRGISVIMTRPQDWAEPARTWLFGQRHNLRWGSG